MFRKKNHDDDSLAAKKLRKVLESTKKDDKVIEDLFRQRVEEDMLYWDILFALDFVDFTKHLYNEAGDVSYYELIYAKMQINKDRKINSVAVKYH